MEIEKTMRIAAPAQLVWAMLLDPHVMGGCVPGMQSIEVVNEDEYLANMHVKISFISAKFKLKTRIVERRAPFYLRTEGTGEDSSVASALKQQSELFLSEQADGQTELRMKVLVDVTGRLGTFGLSVMKTKADRLWDEFARNLAARLLAGTAPAQEAVVPDTAAVTAEAVPAATVPDVAVTTVPASTSVRTASWWQRWFGRAPRAAAGAACIHVEIRRGDTHILVDWPLQGARECAAWLQQWQEAR